MTGDNRPAPKIIIGIVSARNPGGLAKLLNGLSLQAEQSNAHIIVVDNDLLGPTQSTVQSFAKQNPKLKVTVEQEAMPGISSARNRLLRSVLQTGFEYLLMLDDDEYPSDGWLQSMLMKAKAADIVSGPVLPVIEDKPAPPVLKSDFEKQGGRFLSGSVIIESTANLLLSRAVIEEFQGHWFDEHFNLTGGGDTDFLWRTRKAGFSHAIASSALVYEDISSARATPDWLLKRAYRKGNTMARTRQKQLGQTFALIHEGLNLIALFLNACRKRIFQASSPRRGFEAKLDIARARGKMDAFWGRSYNEYAREVYR